MSVSLSFQDKNAAVVVATVRRLSTSAYCPPARLVQDSRDRCRGQNSTLVVGSIPTLASNVTRERRGVRAVGAIRGAHFWQGNSVAESGPNSMNLGTRIRTRQERSQTRVNVLAQYGRAVAQQATGSGFESRIRCQKLYSLRSDVGGA